MLCHWVPSLFTTEIASKANSVAAEKLIFKRLWTSAFKSNGIIIRAVVLSERHAEEINILFSSRLRACCPASFLLGRMGTVNQSLKNKKY